MKVDFVDKMGSDLTVVNAARVSFNKESQFEADGTLSEKDIKLINFLGRERHWTPFASVILQLRIKAPIFVARQLDKHQTGAVKNEVSRRYVDYTPEFYFPEKWRGRPVDKKQGSSDVFIDYLETQNMQSFNGTRRSPIDAVVRSAVTGMLILYENMIKAGVAPEQARMVLPQNMMTEWYWTGSLAFFARTASLRKKGGTAQEETGYVAEQIAEICDQHFPVSWPAALRLYE